MNQKKNIVFDLLKNEHFVRWVQNPTEESNHYWTKWISNHKDGQKDVEIARHVIQSGKLRNNQPVSDEKYDMMLENIMDYARQGRGNGYNRLPNLRRYIRIAASVVIAILGTIIIKNNLEPSDQLANIKTIVKRAPNGSKLTTRLPDGTTVMLNSGSTISFPEKFKTDSREVKLTGEAYFEVAHNPSKPFFVHFRSQQVEVLGTSFNIRSYENESFTKVAVVSGKVSCSVSGGDNVVLRPNETASHFKGTSSLKKGTVNRLEALGWRDRILYFDSGTFDEIEAELERWFGIVINTAGNFEPEGTYSGKFENPSLREVLTGLSFIYRFDFTIEGSNVLITNQTTN